MPGSTFQSLLITYSFILWFVVIAIIVVIVVVAAVVAASGRCECDLLCYQQQCLLMVGASSIGCCLCQSSWSSLLDITASLRMDPKLSSERCSKRVHLDDQEETFI